MTAPCPKSRGPGGILLFTSIAPCERCEPPSKKWITALDLRVRDVLPFRAYLLDANGIELAHPVYHDEDPVVLSFDVNRSGRVHKIEIFEGGECRAWWEPQVPVRAGEGHCFVVPPIARGNLRTRVAVAARLKSHP